MVYATYYGKVNTGILYAKYYSKGNTNMVYTMCYGKYWPQAKRIFHRLTIFLR